MFLLGQFGSHDWYNNSIAYFFQIVWPSLLLFYYIFVSNPTWVILCQLCNCSRRAECSWRKACNQPHFTGLTITSCPLPSSWFLRFSGKLYVSVVHLFLYSSIGLFNNLSLLPNMPTHFPSLSVFSRLSPYWQKKWKRISISFHQRTCYLTSFLSFSLLHGCTLCALIWNEFGH